MPLGLAHATDQPVAEVIPRGLPPLIPSEVADYIRASLSHSSRRAYRSDIEHFQRWGGLIPSPPELVAHYLANHAGVLSAATLARRLVSISKAHTTQGYPSPARDGLVRATLRGIRHTHGSAQRQVAPAVREDILSMVAGLQGVKGLRDQALLLVGFAGAFRRSELVSLQLSDIEWVQQGFIAHLRFSKTDQQGIGRKVAIPYARGASCPVRALQSWIEVAGISVGPIFRSVSKGDVVSQAGLTPQAVALIVKERAKAVGLDPRNYSGHSLRAGLITSAAKLGVSSWKIRQQTGHKSDAMLGRYIRDANIFVDNPAGAVL
ncbi:MAG: site-specific integrase [Betaproteobacteria bacterium]|nr:MAG: site-specific integrase [Betaproteobacteria bacterium]